MLPTVSWGWMWGSQLSVLFGRLWKICKWRLAGENEIVDLLIMRRKIMLWPYFWQKLPSPYLLRFQEAVSELCCTWSPHYPIPMGWDDLPPELPHYDGLSLLLQPFKLFLLKYLFTGMTTLISRKYWYWHWGLLLWLNSPGDSQIVWIDLWKECGWV